MRKLKLMGIIILVLVLLLFIVGNVGPVRVSFLGVSFDLPLILVMLVNLLVGLVLGIFVARNAGKPKSTDPKRLDPKPTDSTASGQPLPRTK